MFKEIAKIESEDELPRAIFKMTEILKDRKEGQVIKVWVYDEQALREEASQMMRDLEAIAKIISERFEK